MYPIEFSDANLNVMGTYKNLFPDYQVGYSDHTIGTTAIQVAIAMGARTIEAHFTDKSIKSDLEIILFPKQQMILKNLLNSLIKFVIFTDRMKNHYWKLKK